MSRPSLQHWQRVAFIAIGICSLLVVGFLQSTPASAAVKASPPARTTHTPHPFYTKRSSGQTSFARQRKSTANNLEYNGGPVMQSTSINYAIFWEPATLQDGSAAQVSPTYNSLIQQYFTDIGGSGLYNINTQYSDSTGNILNSSSLGGIWVDTSPYPASDCIDQVTPGNCISDTQIQNEVQRAMTANNWTGGLTHIFYVFTAKNEGTCYDSFNCAFTQFCAYHSYFPVGNQNILYANMPYTGTLLAACSAGSSPNNDVDADSTINVTSHEHMETVTDPLLSAWYDSSGQEIGDKCAWNFGTTSLDGGQANVQWNNHYYFVQQEWSNAIGDCALSYTNTPPPPPPSSGTVYVGSKDGSIYALNATTGQKLWSFQTRGAVISSPVVVSGTLYVGSNDGSLYALHVTDGSKLWQFQTRRPVTTTPVLANGIVYFTSSDGYLYALNATTGSKVWRFALRTPLANSPAIENNLIYVSTATGAIYVINATTGTKVWSTQYSRWSRTPLPAGYSAPTVLNGIIYVGANNGYLYATQPGKSFIVWRFKVGGNILARPTITNGVIYTDSSNGVLCAIQTSGSALWCIKGARSMTASVTVVATTLYVGASDGNMYAYSISDGSKLWNYQTKGRIDSTPAVLSTVLYIGSNNRNLYALNISDGTLLWNYQTNGGISSSPAAN